MKIKLLTVGKTDTAYLSEAIAVYEKRLQHYIQFEIQTLPDIKNAKSLTENLLKEKEGIALLASFQDSDDVVLLDEKGKSYTSVDFSTFLSKKMIVGTRTLVFVVGGAYGFSQAVYTRASGMLSLSSMTFTHQMIRLFFTEQLYRAFTILKGESYHHQ